MKLIYLKTALVLGMTVMLPSVAIAKKCKSWDVSCKAQKEANQRAQEAQRAASSAQRLAQEQSAAAIQAAEKARLEAERLAAASQQWLQSQFSASLDELYGELREVGLNQLANVNAITDPDMWLREVVNIIMKDLMGESVMNETLETADYLSQQVGKPSEIHPFGDGPVGKQIHEEVKRAYKKALTNTSDAGETAIDYLNPLKNKISPEAEDENTARAMVGFTIPSFMNFKYGTTLQIKPLEITADVDQRIPVVLKGNVSSNFPLLWGDNNKATTAYANAIDNQRFKFQIAIAAALSSKKAYEADEGRKASAEGSLSFDVDCSTVEIGKCQLSKISTKKKVEFKRKSNTSLANQVRKSMALTVVAVQTMQQLALITASRKDELISVLDYLTDAVVAPVNFLDQIDSAIFVPQGTAEKALGRQADMQAMAFMYAIINSIPSAKWESKTSFLGKQSKRAISIDDIESVDITEETQWINADVVAGVFKEGWRFNKSYVLPDIHGIALTKKIGTEAKLEFGNVDTKDAAGKVSSKANESKIGMSAALMASATVGLEFPTSRAIMKFAQGDRVGDALSNAESMARGGIDDVHSFADDIGLGASRFWGEQPDDRLGNLIERSDHLSLPAFIAIMH